MSKILAYLIFTVIIKIILSGNLIACPPLETPDPPEAFDPPKTSYWKGICGPAYTKWERSNGSYDTTGVNSDITDIKYAGISWVRNTFKIGESPAQLDYKINTALNAGLNILLIYRKGIPENTYGTEEQEEANETILRATVARYKDRVKHWEIHNEPNLQQFWDIGERVGEGSSDPTTPYNIGVKKYVQHLERSYKAIKAEDPDAVVILGGLSEWHLESFMDRLLIEGAFEFCDEVAVHPYSTNPASLQKVQNRINSFILKLKEWPAPHNIKPIWITEIGFHSQQTWTSPGKVASEEIKAQYLTETMDLLRKTLKPVSPVRPIFWYTLVERSCNNGFGLTKKCITDGNLQQSYLPAFEAYKAISNNPDTYIYTNDLADQNIELILYPNPVNDRLHLIYSGKLTGTEPKLKILTTDGRTVNEFTRSAWQNQQTTLNISNLPGGAYILSVSTSYGISHKIFLKY